MPNRTTDQRIIGWDVLAAIDTGILALATFALARLTRELSQFSEQSARAEYRPIVVPAADVSSARAVTLDSTQGLLQVRIRNIGRGPALFVRSNLDPGQLSASSWSLGILGPGDEQELAFGKISKRAEFQLLLDYRDIANHNHSTSITFSSDDGRQYSYDVHIFEDHKVTPHGDAVYPQPGLRDVRPNKEKKHGPFQYFRSCILTRP
jgi:hypothetical protein